MNIKEARCFMEQKHAGIHLGLDRLHELLKRLDHPERKLRVIHIAGTNGKGSILAYVSTVLAESGLKTGRFFSPALAHPLERFQINGICISESEYTNIAERLYNVVAGMQNEGFDAPSAFELEAALAFLYFAEKECDIVVLECGMGGETDATNVIPYSEIAVFASISMDHMSFLGDSPEEIAAVKAGIIKKGGSVVSAPQLPEVEAVLRNKARENSCPVSFIESTAIKNLRYEEKGLCWTYNDIELSTKMLGIYQSVNASVAYRVCEILLEKGILPERADIVEAIGMAFWPGRFARIARRPDFILDGAHNPAAAGELARSLQELYGNKRFVFLNGMFKDKDIEGIRDLTVSLADEIFTFTIEGQERSIDGRELAKILRQVHPHVTACRNMEDALQQAYMSAGQDDVIVAFGSLSFLDSMQKKVDAYLNK